MGKKGVPFGYLEFSRAIRGKPCPRAPQPPAAATVFRVRVRVRVPYPVRFFLNRVSRVWVTADRTRSAIWIRNTTTADMKPPRIVTMVGRFLSEMNCCNGSDWTVATVRTDLPPRSAINSAPFLSFQHTAKQSSRNKETQFFFCSDFQQIRSERRLRKFNRFFNRIVVWICDFRRRIFFYLPPFSTVGVPLK